MDRSRPHALRPLAALLLGLAILLPNTGCIHQLLATMVYVVHGNTIDAECKALEGKRVVVVCRPPSSLEYRHGGADREVARRVGQLLAANISNVDVVDPREVENWTDERDWDDYKELAKALKADAVLQIDLEEFELHKGQTLYQGRSDTMLTVYDMKDGGKEVWQKHIGEVLFPANGGVPTSEKPLRQFRRQYVSLLSERIARHFYKHDAHLNFVSDNAAHE